MTGEAFSLLSTAAFPLLSRSEDSTSASPVSLLPLSQVFSLSLIHISSFSRYNLLLSSPSLVSLSLSRRPFPSHFLSIPVLNLSSSSYFLSFLSCLRIFVCITFSLLKYYFSFQKDFKRKIVSKTPTNLDSIHP